MEKERRRRMKRTASYLERTVRIKKGFLEMTEAKRERDGPSVSKAYPIPAATVMAPPHFFFGVLRRSKRSESPRLQKWKWECCAQKNPNKKVEWLYYY
ncbi:hypothetical protein FH972_015142 [Carpinus fangiana]|uniref:Uncharacterized protein n=1 Tax=Carpinus fangiana TaxID=176857 RepID=A0A5N6RBS3_9ROSI|nr:hypothetical protein FH972_015142 [Carpinus fangiana]